MRVTLKSINAELAKRGYDSRLERGGGYFYFSGGAAENWLDRTVRVSSLDSLSLEQWVGEFEKLKALNKEVLKPASRTPPGTEPANTTSKRRSKR